MACSQKTDLVSARPICAPVKTAEGDPGDGFSGRGAAHFARDVPWNSLLEPNSRGPRFVLF